MKVKECMCSNVVWATPDTTIQNIAKQMQEAHIGCVAVCDENDKVVGIVTDRDVILRCIASDKDYKQTPVSDIMTTNVHTVDANDNVTDAINYMCNCQVKRIPVVEEGKLKGIITLGDLAKNSEISDNEVGNAAKCICCGEKNKA